MIATKQQQTDIKISDYECRLDSLKRTYFEDDADWKGLAEAIIEMLVMDRIEILKRRRQLTENGQLSDTND